MRSLQGRERTLYSLMQLYNTYTFLIVEFKYNDETQFHAWNIQKVIHTWCTPLRSNKPISRRAVNHWAETDNEFSLLFWVLINDCNKTQAWALIMQINFSAKL